MLEKKKHKYYVFLVCYYAVGEEKVKRAQNILINNYFFQITSFYKYDIHELVNKVDERLNIIDREFKDVTTLEKATKIRYL